MPSDGTPEDPTNRGELSRGLEGIRADAGLPADAKAQREAPFFSVNLPIDDLITRVANLLKSSDGRWGLYRWGKELVTVDELEGTVEVMTPLRFRSWLPQTRGVMPVKDWKPSKEVDPETGQVRQVPVKGELSIDQAKTILASDEMRLKMPVLKGIHSVRLPVLEKRDGDELGLTYLRLLEHGYDAGSGIYTLRSGLDYRTDLDFTEALDYLCGLFQFFGWRSPTRDFSIHLAALMTMYGRGIYDGKSPMIWYNANIQESGKTTLGSYVCWAVHGGPVLTRSLLQDNDEALKTELDTAALNGDPYVFFDNVDWGGSPVKSAVMDEWISNSGRVFRKLGGNQQGKVALRAVTIGTGNKVTLSTDLQRRSLIIDLLNRLSGADRELPAGATLIDEAFFKDDGNRQMALACCWAILKRWDQDGRPLKPGRVLGSFEGWARVIPSVVWHAGQMFGPVLWDCMAESTNEEIGDKESLEFKKLAEFALAEFGPNQEDGPNQGQMRDTFEITVQQFAGVARRNAVATRGLWPAQDIESVMQEEGKPGGWKEPARSKEEEDDGKPLWEEDVPGTAAEERRRRSASEFMNPKMRSAFGNALKLKLDERYFRGPDGELYELKHRVRVTPARYLVTRVKR